MSNICQHRLRHARPWIMEPDSSFPQKTPEDGCKVQQSKYCDILSQQDEDKSPNNSLYNFERADM